MQGACDGAAHGQRLAVRIVECNEKRLHPLIDRLSGIRQAQMTGGAFNQP